MEVTKITATGEMFLKSKDRRNGGLNSDDNLLFVFH